jgi:hypothetical protein
LTPVVDWLDELGRGRIPRLLAVMVVELFFIIGGSGLAVVDGADLAKELPLMREQLPLVIDSLNSVLAPWLAQWGIPMSLDGGSIQGLAMKYLNANVEDAFGSLMTSLKIGRQRCLCGGRQCHPDSGRPVLFADGLGPFCGVSARTDSTALCVPLPTASWRRRMRCWGSTCVGNCW